MSNPNRDELGRFAEGESINIGMKVSTNAGIGKVVGFGSDQGEQTIDVDVGGQITQNFRHTLRKLPGDKMAKAAASALTRPQKMKTPGFKPKKGPQQMAALIRERSAQQTRISNLPPLGSKAERIAASQKIIADFKKKMGI